ncbi:MAG: ACP S-malonyltransferase [Planctomycetota bacterium]
MDPALTSALLFPGQGAQAVGMGSALTERSPEAKEYFQQASEVLGYDLLELCLQGPGDKLSRTEFSQPALFVHSFAALKQLESEQADLWEKVSCVAGLSLGEYTAVAAAGGMNFEDGVRLVQARGLAMQAAADLVESGMSSVIGMDLEKLEEVCKQATESDNDFVQPANLLCPGNIAVSGHLSALERLEKLAPKAGAMKTVRLQVAGAFHTAIMQPAVERLEAALAEITFSELRVPVYSNVDAKPHSAGEDFKSLLPKQVVSPVLWEASLRAVLETGIEECIEVGTGKVLAGTLKRVQRKFPCSNYGDS